MKYIFIILVSALMVSCASIKVGNITKDDSADFNSYKSFSFLHFDMDNQTALLPEKQNIENLVSSIKDEMLKRGMKEEQDGDLKINIGLLLSETTKTSTTDIRDAPMYIGQRNYHWESEEVVTAQYEEGTVVVELIDSNKNKVVWSGVAKGMIIDDKEKMRARVRGGITKLFAKYPVQAQ